MADRGTAGRTYYQPSKQPPPATAPGGSIYGVGGTSAPTPTNAAQGALQGAHDSTPTPTFNLSNVHYDYGTGQSSGYYNPKAPNATMAKFGGVTNMVNAARSPSARGAGAGAANDNGGTPGTQSGPGILESWFNQRASGTDPAYEYTIGRGADQINRQFAARGGYNSSGAMQSLSDMYANAGAQRMGQLDQLAAGASGEHQRRLEDMFGQGLGIANGQANTAGGYDMAGGNALSAAQRQQLELMLQKAGVDQKTAQGQLDAIFNVGKTGASILGAMKGGGGGGGAAPAVPTGTYVPGSNNELAQPSF